MAWVRHNARAGSFVAAARGLGLWFGVRIAAARGLGLRVGACMAAGGVNNSRGGFQMQKFAVLFVLAFCGVAGATPGGLDRYGCHHSKATGYHCHGLKLSQIVHTYQKETASERSARLLVQCRGLENAGVCFGYAR